MIVTYGANTIPDYCQPESRPRNLIYSLLVSVTNGIISSLCNVFTQPYAQIPNTSVFAIRFRLSYPVSAFPIKKDA